MKKGWTLTQEGFALLLNWLSSDRESAGATYERVRHGLIRLFLIRGCSDPETLADETINRVVLKLPALIHEYSGNPTNYFYGIANNVCRESMSTRQKKEEQLDQGSHSKVLSVSSGSAENDNQLVYLQECLQKLAAEDRE